jgi:hypothetical protein
MGKSTAIVEKPDLPKHLFWDFVYDKIDWKGDYTTVMERVLERGSRQNWEEMIRFYGNKKVITALKKEIKFLADYAIEEVCAYFPLRKEELLCYTRKQSRPGHWI